MAPSLAGQRRRLLLPADTPDDLGFRIMWYNPVPPINKASYRLAVGGMVDRSLNLSLDDLQAYPRVEQSTRLKCVQCWSAWTDWGGQHGAPLRLIAPSKYGYKSAKLITRITFVEEGGGSMACDIGPYYTPGGDILPGYDHPLDLNGSLRKRSPGGEIVEY